MKEVFKVEKDGKEVEYAVVSPKSSDSQKADVIHGKAFADAVRNKALFRASLDAHMKEQGLWNDEKEKEYKDLTKSINDMEYKLKRGGIRASEAREIAIEMRKNRVQLRDLITERTSLDANTAEGKAENARFNCLVSLCLVDNKTGNPIYKDMNDYLENANNEEAFKGAQILAQMMYGLDKDFEKNLPENRFLYEYGFVDDELRLVNKDNQLIDLNGRVINEDGDYVDGDGNVIDVEGRKINNEGEYDVKTEPFLDDEGNPMSISIQKKKRGRPPKKEE